VYERGADTFAARDQSRVLLGKHCSKLQLGAQAHPYYIIHRHSELQFSLVLVIVLFFSLFVGA
jgi:hypothetical protein